MKDLLLQGNFCYSKEVESATKSMKPRVLDVVEIPIEVDLDCSKITDFVEAEYFQIMYELEATPEQAESGTALGFPFTKEQFKKYCVSEIVSRIAWVTNDIDLLIMRPQEKNCVPALLAQSIKAIGVVEDLEHGITYVPKLRMVDETGNVASDKESKKQWKEEHCLTHEEMVKMIRFLRQIDNFVGAPELPKDKSGTIEMCKVGILDQNVVSWDMNSHPAYAVLVAVMGVKYSVSEYYKATVTYGTLQKMGEIICGLTSIV